MPRFRPDKCPCGLPWDLCPWSETVCGGPLGNQTGEASVANAVRRGPPPSKFVCPFCRAVSYNPNDIRERYCGRCHVFVDDALREGCERALAALERREATIQAIVAAVHDLADRLGVVPVSDSVEVVRLPKPA